MDQQLKDKWTGALRSGVYEQACGTMWKPPYAHKGVGYCCLGVLLCVSGKYRHLSDDNHEQYYHFVDDLIGGPAVRNDLTAMNDLQHKTFSEIADYIDANIKAA